MGLTDTRTTENPEPRTEAGKSLYRGMLARYHEGSIGRLVVTDDWLPTILAIETEAYADGMTHMVEKRVAKREAEAAQRGAPRWTTDPDLFADTEPDHFGTCVDCDHLWTLHGEAGCRKDGCVCTERYIEGAAPRAVDDIAGDLWHQREGWHATEGAAPLHPQGIEQEFDRGYRIGFSEGAAPQAEGHEHSFVLQQGATCRCGAAAPQAEGLYESTLEVLAAAAGLDPVNESVRIVAQLATAEYARLAPQKSQE